MAELIDRRQLMAYQDYILLKIADSRKIKAIDLVKLPPWRAWLIVQVMRKANHEIEDLEWTDIRDEAVRVGGAGTLDLDHMLINTKKGK